jgi:hypothetical protein
VLTVRDDDTIETNGNYKLECLHCDGLRAKSFEEAVYALVDNATLRSNTVLRKRVLRYIFPRRRVALSITFVNVSFWVFFLQLMIWGKIAAVRTAAGLLAAAAITLLFHFLYVSSQLRTRDLLLKLPQVFRKAEMVLLTSDGVRPVLCLSQVKFKTVTPRSYNHELTMRNSKLKHPETSESWLSLKPVDYGYFGLRAPYIPELG